jgi:hypothetical protein
LSAKSGCITSGAVYIGRQVLIASVGTIAIELAICTEAYSGFSYNGNAT